MIATGDAKARWRNTLDLRLAPNFSAGIEFTPGTRELRPRATWFITPERGNLPSLALGFTSDRLSTPEGSATFLTASKRVGDRLTPFVSLKYSDSEAAFAVPFGANLQIQPNVTLQAIYDGRNPHFLLTHQHDGTSLSLVLAKGKQIGLSWSVGL